MNNFFIKKSDNIYLYDDKGNKYYDTRFGNGTFLLGHNSQEIKEKIKDQINRGILFGFPNNNEMLLKNKLKDILDCYDDFILCNTGSESIMRAFRIARSYSNKNKIALFFSLWHGSYDGTKIKNDTQLKKKCSSGITNSLLKDIILLSNDEEQIFKILEKEKENLAMIFIEPIQQTIPILKIDFLKKLRVFSNKNNILLGFDEMITGFRLNIKGGQGYTNIYPDITCYGKTIGFGFPIGIVAITEKIKKHINNVKPPIRFGGTFSGNPLSTYAGCLFIDEILKKEDLYEKINKFTEKLCNDLNKYSSDNNIPLKVYYVGSMYRFIFTKEKVESLEDCHKYELSIAAQNKYYEILKQNKLLIGKNPLSFISYLHTSQDISNIYNIYINSLKKWKYEFLIPNNIIKEKLIKKPGKKFNSTVKIRRLIERR